MAPEDANDADDEEIDPDKAPEPKPFQAPKGLLKVPPKAGPVEVKSGAAGVPVVPPPPPPPGAQIRIPRSTPARPPIPPPEALGPVDVRFPKAEPGPRRPLPRAEEMGPVDVRFEKGAPKLPRIEAPGEFDVVIPHAVPEPHPKAPLPTPLEGEVEVVDYRRTGPVEVDQPDVFDRRKRIGIVDTTFARYNMGDAAEATLRQLGGELDLVRRTVPGVKDLAVECKVLLEKLGCEVVLACGMVGPQPVDKTCAHEASLAIQWTQLLTNHHILEVFVHEDEARDERELAGLLDRRTREHAENAWRIVFDPQWLRENAGKGLRQGFSDAGPIPLR